MSTKNKESLKERAISGMVWSSVQKFGTISISFIANLILARLLLPADFGSIGMLIVFIALSDTLIDGGFGSALIQKKTPTNTDYSTVFYWNILLAVFLYLFLFLASPYIADFYSIIELSDLLRVLGAILLINSFNIIQTNILIKQLRFKVLAKRDLISTTIGSIIGVSLAYNDFGAWSLVASILVSGVIKSILLWTTCRWRPQPIFSWDSFKSLFRFGSFMFMSNMTEKLFTHLHALIIGKVFSASSLGYFTQASKLESVPASSLSAIVNQVTFPIFSSLQDDLERVRNAVRKNLKAIVFINFPLMVLLIVVAKPLIIILYTDKWLESVPIFQILCVAAMLHYSNTLNTNVIKSAGLGKLFFKLQLMKRAIALVVLIIGLQFGFLGMIWSVVVYNYIYFFINAYYSGRIIRYGIGNQLKDSATEFFNSIISGILTYLLFEYLEFNIYLDLLLQISVYSVLYLMFSFLFKVEGLFIYKEVLVNFWVKRK